MTIYVITQNNQKITKHMATHVISHKIIKKETKHMMHMTFT